MSAERREKPPYAEPGEALRIAVIGSRGRMGAMLARHWTEAGYMVRGADRAAPEGEAGHASADRAAPEGEAGHASADRADPEGEAGHAGAVNAIDPAELAAAVSGADAVALCVPAQVLPAVLAVASPFLDAGQVLFDITSVKMRPLRQMEAIHRGPVVGTHPLFGPLPLSGDLTVAIVPGARSEERHIHLVRDLFTVFGCRVFMTSAKEHDRGVAFMQGLNFVSSAAYLAALAHREDVLPFLTPSFRRRLEGAKKLLTEDADMFQGFTTANPMMGDAMHTFRLFLDLVEGGGLPDVVKRARWWYEREE